MSKGVSKEYKEIISALGNLKDHCKDMEKEGDAVWETDVNALQEAMDIISDYEKVVSESNRMIQHYETKDKPINRGGSVWCCPECGRRVSYNHSHCHWCGKRIGW